MLLEKLVPHIHTPKGKNNINKETTFSRGNGGIKKTAEF